MTQDEVQAMIADHEEKLRPYYLARNPGEREEIEKMIRITRAAPALYEALRAMVERDEKGGGAEGPAMKRAREVLAMVDDP